MKLSVEKGSENYAAKVIKLGKIFPIEGADRLAQTKVEASTLVISKTLKEGDLMVYFVSGSQLSESYCFENNLYENRELNKDVTEKGYVNIKRRVRAVKLRGIVSDGMLMPLASVCSELKEGDEFTDINGKNVVRKYLIPTKENAHTAKPAGLVKYKLQDYLVEGQFKLHFDTAHLSRNTHKVENSSQIVITSKLHGSSIILANVLTKKQFTLKDKIAKWFGVTIAEKEFRGIWSSGKPKSGLCKGVDGIYKNENQSFYKEDIWKKAYNDYKYALEEGISIYGEVCNESIQKGFDYLKLRDIDKDYVFVVYRITRTNSQGITDEFSWEQVELYCKKYGLQTVPVFYKGSVRDYVGFTAGSEISLIDKLSEEFLEKECIYCVNKVPDEGICVRVESPFEVFKLKSNAFKLVDDKNQEAGEPNIEE